MAEREFPTLVMITKDIWVNPAEIAAVSSLEGEAGATIDLRGDPKRSIFAWNMSADDVMQKIIKAVAAHG